MNEQKQARSAPGTTDFSAVPDMPQVARKRCAQCGRPFGLTRRRHAAQQFCSLRCVHDYVEGIRKAVTAKARWQAFLYLLR